MATNEFIQKIETALEKLVTLNIVTVVGEAQFGTTATGQDLHKITLPPTSKVIWTAIDLLQGDITTVVHPEYQGEAGKDLREFHKARETQGLAIIKENIAALRDVVKLLHEAYQSRSERPKDLPPAPASR